MVLEGREEVTKIGSSISNGGGWAQLAAAMTLVNRMTFEVTRASEWRRRSSTSCNNGFGKSNDFRSHQSFRSSISDCSRRDLYLREKKLRSGSVMEKRWFFVEFVGIRSQFSQMTSLFRLKTRNDRWDGDMRSWIDRDSFRCVGDWLTYKISTLTFKSKRK